MSNPNEYIEDGKIYIKEMKSCVVESIKCGEYQLICNIHQRGKKGYVYKPWEKDFISRVKKRLWLSDWARMQIAFAIDEYEAEVKAFKETANHFRAEYTKVDVWFAPNPDGNYRYFFEYCSDNIECASKICESCCLHSMLSDMDWFINYYTNISVENPFIKYIEKVKSVDELQYNPLFKYAQDTGDELLQLELKLHFKLATKDECERYSKLTGKRILPTLPADYDREYAVFAAEVDMQLLEQSGYSVSHVPYFAMRGRTHRMDIINPHTKIGKDAAPVESEAIHFEEFLELFTKV